MRPGIDQHRTDVYPAHDLQVTVADCERVLFFFQERLIRVQHKGGQLANSAAVLRWRRRHAVINFPDSNEEIEGNDREQSVLFI